MPLPQIKKLNHRHHAIVNWLVANPHQNLLACAAAFNYTPAAIYYIVNSGMFQALYKRRCEELGLGTVHDMRTRVAALAAATIDKSLEKVQSGGASEKFLLETTKNLLPALGFGQAPEVHEHQHLHVDGLDMQLVIEARERAALRKSGAAPMKFGLGNSETKLIESEPNVA